MSIILPPFPELQRFYRSMPMACPYLPGQIERKLFTRLQKGTAGFVNSALTQVGFRRSHDIVYRPVCPHCSACWPVRIPVTLYQTTSNQRRILRRNKDLTSRIVASQATEEQYHLFISYQRARHEKGEMARMSWSDYSAMVRNDSESSNLIEWRDQNSQLKAVLLIDAIGDGISAVYSFFDTADTRRSLGTFIILNLIEQVTAKNLDYVYLGYYISGSQKMDYKARFQPLEVMGPDGWQKFKNPYPLESAGAKTVDVSPTK